MQHINKILKAVFLLVVVANKEYVLAKCKLNADTNPDMIECAWDYYQKSDKQLNIVYKQAQASLSKPKKMQLKEAQKKWIAFRDSYCSDSVFTEENYGRLAPLGQSNCLENLTTMQTSELAKTFLYKKMACVKPFVGDEPGDYYGERNKPSWKAFSDAYCSIDKGDSHCAKRLENRLKAIDSGQNQCTVE